MKELDEYEIARQAAFMPPASNYNELLIDPQAAKMLKIMALISAGLGAAGAGSPALKGFGNLNPGRLPGRAASSWPNKRQDLSRELVETPADGGPRTAPSNQGPAVANLKAMDKGVPQLVPMRESPRYLDSKGEPDWEVMDRVRAMLDFHQALAGMKKAPGNATYPRKGPSQARPY